MVKKMSLAALVAVSMLMVQTVVPMEADVRYSQLASDLKNQEDPAAHVKDLLDHRELKNPFNLQYRADLVLEFVNPSEDGDTVLAILARKGKGRTIRKVIAYLQDYQVRAEANPNLARMVDPHLAVPGDLMATIKKEITNDPNGDTTLLHIAARAPGRAGDAMESALDALLSSREFTPEDANKINNNGETVEHLMQSKHIPPEQRERIPRIPLQTKTKLWRLQAGRPID